MYLGPLILRVLFDMHIYNIKTSIYPSLEKLEKSPLALSKWLKKDYDIITNRPLRHWQNNWCYYSNTRKFTLDGFESKYAYLSV